MKTLYRGSKCNCPKNICKEYVDPVKDCIYKLEGEIVTKHCPKCCKGTSHTWHQDGKCLACKDE